MSLSGIDAIGLQVRRVTMHDHMADDGWHDVFTAGR
jgi:hypothetical protein